MPIKYNVYHAQSPQGPWTKANDTLISDVTSGNNYTITGLVSGVLYYVVVVGGRINEDGDWVPLSGQSIGPEQVPAIDIANPNIISVRTFTPRTNQTTSLAMKFEVI